MRERGLANVLSCEWQSSVRSGVEFNVEMLQAQQTPSAEASPPSISLSRSRNSSQSWPRDLRALLSSAERRGGACGELARESLLELLDVAEQKGAKGARLI